MITVMLFAAVVVLCVTAGIVWGVSTHTQKRHVTQRELRRRAEYENWLANRGDPRGFWGRYPPDRTHP